MIYPSNAAIDEGQDHVDLLLSKKCLIRGCFVAIVPSSGCSLQSEEEEAHEKATNPARQM